MMHYVNFYLILSNGVSEIQGVPQNMTFGELFRMSSYIIC